MELDPRFDWHEIKSWDGALLRHVRGDCHHVDVVPVESGSEVVAQLCRTCDAQLPAPVVALR